MLRYPDGGDLLRKILQKFLQIDQPRMLADLPCSIDMDRNFPGVPDLGSLYQVVEPDQLQSSSLPVTGGQTIQIFRLQCCLGLP